MTVHHLHLQHTAVPITAHNCTSHCTWCIIKTNCTISHCLYALRCANTQDRQVCLEREPDSGMTLCSAQTVIKQQPLCKRGAQSTFQLSPNTQGTFQLSPNKQGFETVSMIDGKSAQSCEVPYIQSQRFKKAICNPDAKRYVSPVFAFKSRMCLSLVD